MCLLFSWIDQDSWFQAKEVAPLRKRRFFWRSMILSGWSCGTYILQWLDEKVNFNSKNKAAQIHGSRRICELPESELLKISQALPEYLEQKSMFSLHLEVAGLSSDDMDAVKNLRLLAAPSETKKSSIGGFALNFNEKKKHGVRKERSSKEAPLQLSRFYPTIEELVEKLSKGELPKDEYPCMNERSPAIHETAHPAAIQDPGAHSMRSRRTPTWARPRHSNDGYSSNSVVRHASSDFRKMGRRIFVFIAGGASRSELRACHELTAKLKREVILGSSTIDDPAQFIKKLKLLSASELSLDDIEI